MNALWCRSLFTGVVLVALASMLPAQPLPSGRWDGAIRIMNQELGIRVHFAPKGDSLAATIDIPMQNAFGLPLRDVRFDPPALSFDLPAGPGLATFRGSMVADSIGGLFEQAGMAGTFFLRPVLEDSAAVARSGLQLPYEAHDVTFANDSLVLAGTLTIPTGKGPFPAVALITGSGPQNRDEEIFGFKPFAMLADHLTRSGIAVLRYDDRGVGASGGRFSDATTSDFSADAEAALVYLRKHPGIRKDAVGLLGHSEGGIAAAMVAMRRKDVSFLVLLATPAISGDSVIDFQVMSAARRSGASQEDLDRILDLQHRVYETVRRGTGFEELEGLLVEEGKRSLSKLSEENRRSITNPDSLVRSRVGLQIASLKSPWFREFIMVNPADALGKVSCPVFALFGEVDQQVPPSLNRAAMERAFVRGGNRDVEVRTVPKANHLFLTSETGDPAEYGSMKKEFVEGFLGSFSTWLRTRYVP